MCDRRHVLSATVVAQANQVIAITPLNSSESIYYLLGQRKSLSSRAGQYEPLLAGHQAGLIMTRTVSVYMKAACIAVFI